MFDIYFTDPSRETVGQHKSRKENKASGISRCPSVRTSRSSESTQSNPTRGFLSLLGGASGREPRLSKTGSKNVDIKNSRRASSYTVARDSSVRDFSEPAVSRAQTIAFEGSTYDTDADQSSPTSEAAESVFSGYTGRTSTTNSSWGSDLNSPTGKHHAIQKATPNAVIARHAETINSAQETPSLAEQVATAVHISSARTTPVQIEETPKTLKHISTTFDFPVPKTYLEEEPIPVDRKIFKVQSVTHVSNTVSLGLRSPRRPSALNSALEENTINRPVPKLLPASFRTLNTKRLKPPRLTHSHFQQSIRRMEAASSKIILERLKEEWVEVVDASVYRELELENQRWMLFALRDLKTTRLSSAEETRTFQVLSTGATSVLSLYENHASASFLSAFSSPITNVHHICKSPLSPKSYPNVCPATVSEYSTDLPYENESFTSIHAFSLPILFPAYSIPQILTECHRLLSPSSLAASPTSSLQPSSIRDNDSTLHLTIIDPSPLAATVGPLLRAWLDDHLILNLEKQFRCINPSRHFPMWLKDAGLRGEGSMSITVPFLASINTGEAENLLLQDGQAKEAVMDKNYIIKQELKSVVGRMLWKEMWGPFVQARRWWWEDANIIEECERMKTCWEYSVIDAVKGISDG